MESAILAVGAGAGVALLLTAVLLVVLVVLSRRRHHARADLEAMLAAAQRESDDLRHRLEELTALRLEELTSPRVSGADNGRVPAPRSSVQQADFVITRAGEPEPVSAIQVPDRMVLSATLGEPLVKVAAFSYGVRRALSPRSRNRIWFEMRNEVRAARRRRRRLRKDLEREFRARERATEGIG
jgi:hypothetical protein